MDKLQFIPIITEWQNIITSVEGVERDYQHTLLGLIGSKPIKIVSGFRRSGKSFLVQQVARTLIEKKIFKKENILYLNFEDYRFSALNRIASLDLIIKMFMKELSSEGKRLLIFDEIQKVAEWDKLIRTLYEKEKQIEMIVTGSNSEMLSSELGSNLAGRFIELQIQPFDFCEFLRFKNINIRNEIDFYKYHDTIELQFNEFIKFGGLPEIFTITDQKAKYSYLEGILSKVILDDIIERFNIRQVTVLEKIFHYLIMSTGNTVSLKKIGQYIKTQDSTIKTDTVALYVDYIIKTFALFRIEKFDWKVQRVFSISQKYYAIDTGLVNLYGTMVSNYSKQLENCVYLALKRRYGTVYYGALPNGKEIDFIVKENDNHFNKYQITTTLTPENSERELSSLSHSDKYLDTGDNYLLSMDDAPDEILVYKDCTVQKKNIVKWLSGVI